MRRWCQRRMVSGVTMVATFGSRRPPQDLPSWSESPPLVIRKPKTPMAELLAQDTILFHSDDTSTAAIQGPYAADFQVGSAKHDACG